MTRPEHEALVEKVARHLWALEHDEGEPDNYKWETHPETGREASLVYAEHSREEYREQARAAIFLIREALRTPSEEMVEAWDGASWTQGIATSVLNAMTDREANKRAATSDLNAMLDASALSPG